MTSMNDIIATTNSFLVEEFEADASLIKPDANLKEVLDCLIAFAAVAAVVVTVATSVAGVPACALVCERNPL